MIKLDWKVYAVIAGILLLLIMFVFLEKFFFFLIISSITVLVAVILGFVQPLKYIGVELVTLSTILVGILYGPLLGGIYAFTILLAHLMLGRYYMGAYLSWIIPEYILLGVVSGIFGSQMVGFLGVAFIVLMNSLNVFFTFLAESDRVAKELPYVVGNTILNSVVLLKFFESVIGFVS